MTNRSKLIPLAAEDHAEWLDQYFTTACIVIDRVLPQSLKDVEGALVDLLRKEGWNKLAHRLVGNAKKQELCHKFTEKTFSDPVNFTSTVHPGPIASHPLASQLPGSPRTSLSTTPDIKHFRSLFQHPNCCKSLVDLQKRGDYSPTSAHVTVFSDATLIGLTVPHSIADWATMCLLISAWLNPKTLESLLPISPLGETPLDGVGDEMEDGPACGIQPAKGWTLLKLQIRFGWDLLRTGFTEEGKMIYISGETMRELRQLAAMELVKERGEWVSDHDLVVAFSLKLFYPNFTPKSKSTFTFHRSMDSRRWAPSLFENFTLLGIGTFLTACQFPTSQIATLSTPKLALILRRSLQDLCTPESEVQKCIRMLRTYRKRKDGSSGISHAPPAVSCTSWCHGKLGEVVDGIRWTGGFLDNPPGFDRYSMAVVYKDKEGGYYVATDKTGKQWKGIEKALQKYNAQQGTLAATTLTPKQ